MVDPIVKSMLDKIKKGVKEPAKIPPYLLGKYCPSSVCLTKLKKRKKEDGFYTFEEGGFAGGTEGRSEFSARNFHEITQIYDIFEKYSISADRSIEIGAGYGRLSPWIARLSYEHYAIEPNGKAINKAKQLYPHIQWEEGTIQDVSLEHQSFDLIVTWTVLQHIPPGEIEKSIENIMRLSSDSGYLLICEETQGDGATNTWPRDVEKYNNLFKNMELIDVRTRELEPSYEPHGGNVMIFKN